MNTGAWMSLTVRKRRRFWNAWIQIMQWYENYLSEIYSYQALLNSNPTSVLQLKLFPCHYFGATPGCTDSPDICNAKKGHGASLSCKIKATQLLPPARNILAFFNLLRLSFSAHVRACYVLSERTWKKPIRMIWIARGWHRLKCNEP